MLPGAPCVEELLEALRASRRDIQASFSEHARQWEALHAAHWRQQDLLIASFQSGRQLEGSRDGAGFQPTLVEVQPPLVPLSGWALAPPGPEPQLAPLARRTDHCAPPLPPAPPQPFLEAPAGGGGGSAWQLSDAEDLPSIDLTRDQLGDGDEPRPQRVGRSFEELPLASVLPGAPEEFKPAPLPLDTGPRSGRRENVLDDVGKISAMLQVDQNKKKRGELSNLSTMTSDGEQQALGKSQSSDNHSEDSPPAPSSTLNARRHTRRNTRMMAMENEPVLFRYQEKLRIIVMHNAFSVLSLFVILANAAYIGVQTNVTMLHELDAFTGSRGHTDFMTYMWVENSFCFYFLLELFLRFLASPNYFFVGPEWRWNLFDGLLVATCIVDMVMGAAEVNYNASAQYVRILRVVRMARILRIIRVMRFFRSLRIMVHSILNSMAELLWVFVLLFFFIYVTSIFLASTVTQYFKELGPAAAPLSEEQQLLVSDLGSVPAITVELFSAISGGRDWTDLLRPLLEVHIICGVVFILYIFFVVFGVLNVVTGAFVDSIRLVSQRDNDLVIEEELKKVNTFREEIEEIFNQADCDESGTLSWDEFEQHLQDERVRAYFASLELDISEAKALFRLLDIEESDEIPIDKFIQGCLRMRGDAKSIDVNMILYENEKMLLKLTQFSDYAEDQFDRLMRAVQATRGGLAQIMGARPEQVVEAKDLGEPRSRGHRRSSRQWMDERRQSHLEDRRRASLGSAEGGEEVQKAPSVANGARPAFHRGKSMGCGRLEAALNVISVCAD